ncbi:type II secretion system secretin GspD [Deltaproteobacteria bacterium TL4]
MKIDGKRWLYQFLLTGLCLSLATVLFAVPPKSTPAPAKGQVYINLPATIDLTQFIKIIASETNTVFVYEEKNLRGKMSITSPPNIKVTPEDAFFIFEQLLSTQGLTMVRRIDSNIVEIIPSRDARYAKLEMSKEGGAPVKDPKNEFLMQLIHIQYADLKMIKGTLSPIFSKTGVIITYDPLDLLIVIDTQVNVQRIVEIVNVLDVEEPEASRQQVTLYQTKHSQVKDIHRTVSSLFTNIVRNGRRENIKFIIEERLNSLIILANKLMTEEILDFLEKIDISAQGAGATLTVYELKFASANVLAPLLTKIFQTSSNAPSLTVAPTSPPATAPAAPVPAAPPKVDEASSSLKLTDSVPVATKIMPFDNLNALILISDSGTTEEMINLIKKLDVARGDVKIRLHPLKFASAKIVAPLLSRIFSDQIVAGKGTGGTAVGSPVQIFAETRLNSLLIIADNFSTLRVLNLVNELDVPEGNSSFKITFHLLQYASATDVAEMLKQVFAQQAQVVKDKAPDVDSDIKIIPEKRLNALLIIANPQTTEKAMDLIDRLDVSVGEGQGNFKVYPLEYAVAKDLATLLKELTKGIATVSAEAIPKTPATPDKKGADISISADEATNSLLIFGPNEVFPTLDRIIKQLDIRRLQVYVEAMVVEVSLSKSLELGVNWTAGGPASKNSLAAASFSKNVNVLSEEQAPSNLANHTLGFVGGKQLTLGGSKFFSFGAFIKATQTDSEINVLSNPQLLMLNNEEATINVATVVPVGTNSVVDANGNRTTQIEYRDVGILLTIRPQISGEDSIRLVVKETSSNIVAKPVDIDQSGVVTLKRELQTAVLTGDGDIVALGGLINEKVSSSGSKVPGLGDLPLLGWLFRNTSNEVEKTNLILFIRPRIIRTQEDLIEVTKKVDSRYHDAAKGKALSGDVVNEILSPQSLRKNNR